MPRIPAPLARAEKAAREAASRPRSSYNLRPRQANGVAAIPPTIDLSKADYGHKYVSRVYVDLTTPPSSPEIPRICPSILDLNLGEIPAPVDLPTPPPAPEIVDLSTPPQVASQVVPPEDLPNFEEWTVLPDDLPALEEFPFIPSIEIMEKWTEEEWDEFLREYATRK